MKSVSINVFAWLAMPCICSKVLKTLQNIQKTVLKTITLVLKVAISSLVNQTTKDLEKDFKKASLGRVDVGLQDKKSA